MNGTARALRSGLGNLLDSPDDRVESLARQVFTEAATMDVAYPINRLNGVGEILDRFILPLRTSMAGASRRDEIFISGRNRRANGGDWMASFTHYVGNLHRAFLGIRPSGRLSFLRSGEFYRLEGSRIAEARLIIDLPDLMRQTDCGPFPEGLGAQVLFPGPSTHDGILPGDPKRGERSLNLVEAMLADLRDYDSGSYDSANQTGEGGYWHENMFWYGPGGIGSSYRWEGFVKDHRKSFLDAFPDRVGGNHYCRIGDGSYAAVSGWPSMTMTHAGPYLGIPPTGRRLTLRVMDFYRCTDSRIVENWVMLDLGDLALQMGFDILGRK